MSVVKIKKRDNPFVQIDKRCLDDERLTWAAKGILAYLLSKPDDWEVKMSDLQKKAKKAGRDFVQNCMNELKEVGYATLETSRKKDGTLAGKKWVVTEEPTTGFSGSRLDTDNRENRPTVEPIDGESAHTNNESFSNNESTNVGGKPPAQNGKKELHAPKWMVEAFEEIYEKEFAGIGKFNWQNKHFGENGLSGFYSRLSKRYLERNAGVQEAPQEALQKSWREFLKIAASIEWIKKGFFTPTDLYNQFDKIGQEWKARQEKSKAALKPQTNGTAFVPSDIPIFIKRD